jgi:hypothetical protein
VTGDASTLLTAIAPLEFNNHTRALNITQASSTQNGYLSSADWNIFNGKENVLTFASPILRSLNAVSLQQSSATLDGYLSATDWNIFNNKEGSLTGGTALQYYRGDKTWATLNQAAVAGLTTADSPTFAGATIGSLSGILLGTAGVVSAITDNSANWNTAYGWGNHASAGYFVGTSSTIRALLSSSATGLTYTNTTGVFTLTSGYVIPTTTEETNWNSAYSASHARAHGLLTVADHSDVATYLNQALLTGSSPTFAAVTLSGLNPNYVVRSTTAGLLTQSLIQDNGAAINIGAGNTTEVVNIVGNVMLAYGAARSFYVEQKPTDGVGYALSVYAGKGHGEDGGGALNLYGGQSGGSTAITGDVNISGSNIFAIPTGTGLMIGSTNAPVTLAELYGASGAVNLTITSAHATGTPGISLRTGTSPTQKWIMGTRTDGSFSLEYGAGALGSANTAIFTAAGLQTLGIGIGTTPPTTAMAIIATPTDAGYLGYSVTATHTSTGAMNQMCRGLYFDVRSNYAGANTGASAALIGFEGVSYHNSAQQLTLCYAGNIAYGATLSGATVVSWTRGINLQAHAVTGTTTGNLADIYINALNGGGTVTNEWCIYSLHAAPSYFKGVFTISPPANTASFLSLIGANAGDGVPWNNYISGVNSTWRGEILLDLGIQFGTSRPATLYETTGLTFNMTYGGSAKGIAGWGSKITMTYLGQLTQHNDNIVKNMFDPAGTSYINGGALVIGDMAAINAAALTVIGTNGKLILTDSVTDDGNKASRFGMNHFDVHEEPFYMMHGVSQNGVNALYLGGATGLGNAATSISFYTAASATTTTGTERMTISATGVLVLIEIAAPAVINGGLYVNSTDHELYFGIGGAWKKVTHA